MEIYKIIAIAVVTALLCSYLKSVKSEFYVPALVVGGGLILLSTINYLNYAFTSFSDFIRNSGIDSDLLKLIIKITLIAYLIEFSGNLVEDLGFKSLGDKLSFAGKILLFCLSLPIFKSLFQVISVFLN